MFAFDVRPTLVLCIALALTSCAGAQEPQAQVAQPQASDSGAVPELLRRAPWSTELDAMGNVQHSHGEARLRFTSSVIALDLRQIEIFDQTRNDVGVFYVGELINEPTCLIHLSVFVYPATASLAPHLEEVKAEIVARNPDAAPTSLVLDLNAAHGEQGVQAGYTNTRDGLEVYEGVSLFQRGRWFVKYRVTLGPPGKPACERLVFDAVSALQLR